MPKISFIVTACNRPDALRTCLSSLIQQTERDWEAIVVDNSGDGIENCEHCRMDDRITYWQTFHTSRVENQIHTHSLYKATDYGAELATSPYLVFPNDDSYYCPWFAERMLDAAEKNAWQLVYCDIIAGGAGGHWLLQASPRLCCIDKTNIMLARERYIGWPDAETNYAQADGSMVMRLVEDGISHGRVPQCLVVHN